MRARLARYALWEARDFLVERALAILFAGGALIFVGREMFTAGSLAAIARGGSDALRFGAVVMKGVVDLAWVAFPLIAARGIVADDRTTGRYRLLFAKPVSVTRLYAQRFAVHGALMMLCAALVVAGTRLIVPLSARTAVDALLLLLASYLLLGGICFAFSALWRWDWISLAAVLGASTWLAGHFATAWWLTAVPPIWKIWTQLTPLQRMEPVSWQALAWPAAYGVACFLLGLLVLRRRQLAT